MNQNFKKYVIFWLSQSVSLLGSSMTSFALILWVYSIRHSAMTVSLMAFCRYVPDILTSLFAGAFVDGHSKKKIMLAADSAAALATLAVLALYLGGGLGIWPIYLINCVIGIAGAFQAPASSVVVGILVPEEKLANASGMVSFSGNLISIFAPVMATALYGFGGLDLILTIDLLSFAFAFLILLFAISIPEKSRREALSDDPAQKGVKRESLFDGCRAGYAFLRQHSGLFLIMITLSMLNFFSRLTYENILSPMILSRSGQNPFALSVVNAAMGIGGVLGGVLVSAGKMPKNAAKTIYVSAGFSFLLGDLLMGLGRCVPLWAFAGFMASAPIPFINAGQNVILYRTVPPDMQGRVFSVRNAIQFCTIPFGILLGGFLADYVFEPFLQSDGGLARFLRFLVGSGDGSGMAVMFLCTGLLGSLCSFLFYRQKKVRALGDL